MPLYNDDGEVTSVKAQDTEFIDVLQENGFCKVSEEEFYSKSGQTLGVKKDVDVLTEEELIAACFEGEREIQEELNDIGAAELWDSKQVYINGAEKVVSIVSKISRPEETTEEEKKKALEKVMGGSGE